MIPVEIEWSHAVVYIGDPERLTVLISRHRDMAIVHSMIGQCSRERMTALWDALGREGIETVSWYREAPGRRTRYVELEIGNGRPRMVRNELV